jgi:hypothetical protein
VDPAAGADVLARLLARYLGSADLPLAQQLLRRSDREVAIIIEPAKVFVWNYTTRMSDSVPGAGDKLCPA